MKDDSKGAYIFASPYLHPYERLTIPVFADLLTSTCKTIELTFPPARPLRFFRPHNELIEPVGFAANLSETDSPPRSTISPGGNPISTTCRFVLLLASLFLQPLLECRLATPDGYIPEETAGGTDATLSFLLTTTAE